MSRRAAPFALPVILLALVVGSCARSVALGHEEAVEVMVLDGTDRARAVCIVDALDGEMDLAKVTGLDVDLSADELARLADTSSRCAPALAATGGVVAGPPMNETTLEAEQAASGPGVDVDEEISRMIDEGLDPTLAECLIVELTAFPDPSEVFADPVRFSGLVVDCREAS